MSFFVFSSIKYTRVTNFKILLRSLEFVQLRVDKSLLYSSSFIRRAFINIQAFLAAVFYIDIANIQKIEHRDNVSDKSRSSSNDNVSP